MSFQRSPHSVTVAAAFQCIWSFHNNQLSQGSESGTGFSEYNKGTQLQQFKKFPVSKTGAIRKFVDRKLSPCSSTDTNFVFKSSTEFIASRPDKAFFLPNWEKLINNKIILDVASCLEQIFLEKPYQTKSSKQISTSQREKLLMEHEIQALLNSAE